MVMTKLTKETGGMLVGMQRTRLKQATLMLGFRPGLKT